MEGPDPKGGEDIAWRWLVSNVCLLLILVLELSAIDQVYLVTFKIFENLGWLAKSLTNAGIVVTTVIALIKSQRDNVYRRLLQNPISTLVLGISATLVFFPAKPAFVELVRPEPVLLIVPATGLFSRVTQADKESGASYLLSVRESGDKVLVESDMTGIGSLLVGRDPEAWLKKAEAGVLEKAKAMLSDHLGKLTPEEKGPILQTWTKSPHPVSAKLPKQGELKFELFTVLKGKRDAVAVGQETICLSGTKLQVILLEDPRNESHEPNCVR